MPRSPRARGSPRTPAARPLAALGVALTAAGWLAAALWAFSRVVTDRFSWSQYAFWVPAEAYALAAAVLFALGALALRPGRRREGRRPRWRRLAPAAALVVIAAHLALVKWRVPNLATRPARDATPGALRVAHWNCAIVFHTADAARAVARADADVLVLSNLWSTVNWPMVQAAYAAAVAASLGNPAEPPTIHAMRLGDYLVFSRLPVRRWGLASLGIAGSPRDWDEFIADAVRDVLGGTGGDPGRALALELDATSTALGRPVTLWVMDLPSSPALHRRYVAARARAALDAWPGPLFAQGHVSEPAAGFPPPDVVIGDFNIPRGSGSLRLLLPAGFVNAFDQAGAGYAATWPRHISRLPRWPEWPLLHIDQAFVSPDLRAARYDVIDPLVGYHYMQRVEIVPRPR